MTLTQRYRLIYKPLVWMAALGIVMGVEKIGTSKRFTHVVGVALIGIGVFVVLSAVVAHWPRHEI